MQYSLFSSSRIMPTCLFCAFDGCDNSTKQQRTDHQTDLSRGDGRNNSALLVRNVYIWKAPEPFSGVFRSGIRALSPRIDNRPDVRHALMCLLTGIERWMFTTSHLHYSRFEYAYSTMYLDQAQWGRRLGARLF